MTFTIHPVILCGGSGTRLWPLSTPKTPKQFLALTSSKSMIEETAVRFRSTDRKDLNFASILVVGSQRHERLLSKTLLNANMILEPMGRNSAPAVAAATMAHAPDDLILILPADHDIRDVPAFHDAIAIAAQAARTGAIVTFGIEPTHPATGYGYIKAASSHSENGALTVDAFVEKPDLVTAQSYLDSGSYYWNAGIFLFKASVMLEALKTFAPEVQAGTLRALNGSVGRKIQLDAEAFSATPSISIDYAVMEHASNVKTVPVSMGWSDVGGYHALHALLTRVDSENYTSGPVHIQNSHGLYVRSEGPAVSVNGASDLVIVATENEVMITRKDDDSAVKELGKVTQENRYTLGISPVLRDRAREWLWTAFDVWSEQAWDPERGGFVEQLDMNGKADRLADRRVRVQARQVFSFSKAIEMGWPGADKARDLVEKGLEYIDQRLRNPDGGFVHLINSDGHATDHRRDLYDHAFIILAGATAYKTLDLSLGLKIADDAIAYIDGHLKDTMHGGWFESNVMTLPRRANPHMHLLEAFMEYHVATGSQLAIDRAAEIVRLFETSFFNPATNVMAEFFEKDWAVSEPLDKATWEPGHHYEWAALLAQFESITEHDTLSWRRRLIRHANQSGLNAKTGFAVNASRADGGDIGTGSRLWHQLERARASLLHPSIESVETTNSLIQALFESYLDPGPAGGWIDELDKNGKIVSTNVPASMLYHAVTSLELLRS